MDRDFTQYGPEGPVELTGELSPDFQIFSAQVFFSDASYSRLEEACQDYGAARRGGDGAATGRAFAELPRLLGRAEGASKAARDTARRLLAYGEMDEVLSRDVEASFRLLCRRTGKIQDLRSHIEGVALSMDVDYLDLVMRIGRSLPRDQTSLDGYACGEDDGGCPEEDVLDDGPSVEDDGTVDVPSGDEDGREDDGCGEDGDVFEDFREEAEVDAGEDEAVDPEYSGEEEAGDDPGEPPAEEPGQEPEPQAEEPAEAPAEPRRARAPRRRRE